MADTVNTAPAPSETSAAVPSSPVSSPSPRSSSMAAASAKTSATDRAVPAPSMSMTGLAREVSQSGMLRYGRLGASGMVNEQPASATRPMTARLLTGALLPPVA